MRFTPIKKKKKKKKEPKKIAVKNIVQYQKYCSKTRKKIHGAS